MVDDWYDTLRPYAGFPLPIEADIDAANKTNDYSLTSTVEDFGYLANGDTRIVAEKLKQVATRPSRFPSTSQPTRPWDVLLGAWPWTGDKLSLQRPLASTPTQFDSDLVDALPTPTGTNFVEMPNTPNFAPYPVTFRAPPQPWDTGTTGQYVDGGT